MSFCSEKKAFRQLQRVLGESAVQLIDTYEPLEGARVAAQGGAPLAGVRLDSGDFLTLSRQVRQIWTRLVCPKPASWPPEIWTSTHSRTGERRSAHRYVRVGTSLATSADAPSLSAVYKLVEMEISGIHRFTAKYSQDKPSYPGAKQVFRAATRDVIARSGECGNGEALLRPVILAAVGGAAAHAQPGAPARFRMPGKTAAGLAPTGSRRTVAGDLQPRTPRSD